MCYLWDGELRPKHERVQASFTPQITTQSPTNTNKHTHKTQCTASGTWPRRRKCSASPSPCRRYPLRLATTTGWRRTATRSGGRRRGKRGEMRDGRRGGRNRTAVPVQKRKESRASSTIPPFNRSIPHLLLFQRDHIAALAIKNQPHNLHTTHTQPHSLAPQLPIHPEWEQPQYRSL